MGVGVNTTDPLAATVHGTNPQNLVEKITRLKVYASLYWKVSPHLFVHLNLLVCLIAGNPNFVGTLLWVNS